jgi:hypothetical protein
MSAYFGGRSEVHHRRIISESRYCDFLSMYPTVCTLLGLWPFVIANGLKWQNSTVKTRELLKSVTLADLQNPSFWPKLTTLVQIVPDGDILPVRANYGGDQQSTIGLNYALECYDYWRCCCFFTLKTITKSAIKWLSKFFSPLLCCKLWISVKFAQTSPISRITKCEQDATSWEVRV